MNHVVILYDDSSTEFQVPDGVSFYFTSDLGDAVDTARAIHGEDAQLELKLIGD